MTIISGTNAAVILPMPSMPPRTAAPTAKKMTTPATLALMPKASCMPAAMELPWARLPMPKEAKMVNRVNAAARNLPKRPPTPVLKYSCGPPCCLPFLSVVRKRTPRYASEYFDAMPTMPVSQIQNSAPGPPMEIAVATPTMLPVPTVAARAVVSAW